MHKEKFISLLERLQAEGEIGVAEWIEMMDGSGPLLDADGNQIINDVVMVGDGRLYIDRDGNEPEAEQAIIDLLANLYDFLPDIIAALKAQV